MEFTFQCPHVKCSWNTDTPFLRVTREEGWNGHDERLQTPCILSFAS